METVEIVLSTNSVTRGFSPSTNYIGTTRRVPFGTESNLSRATEKQLEARGRLLTEAGLQGDEERDINGLVLLSGRKTSRIDHGSNRGGAQKRNKNNAETILEEEKNDGDKQSTVPCKTVNNGLKTLK